MEPAAAAADAQARQGLGSLAALPDHLLSYVMYLLGSEDLGRLACCSRLLRLLSAEEPLWLLLSMRAMDGRLLEYKVFDNMFYASVMVRLQAPSGAPPGKVRHDRGCASPFRHPFRRRQTGDRRRSWHAQRTRVSHFLGISCRRRPGRLRPCPASPRSSSTSAGAGPVLRSLFAGRLHHHTLP
jgi:hypothetical protein